MLFHLLRCAGFTFSLLAGIVLAVPANLLAEDAPALDQSGDSKQIRAALALTGDWEFVDTPLRNVVASLRKTLDIDVILDRKALEEFGISSGTPVTRASSGISNRSFLRLLLNDLELTYVVRDDALWITTPEAAEALLDTRVYPVGDLIASNDEVVRPVFDYEALIDVITNSIAAASWDEVGGPGSIEGIYGALVVSTTGEVHEQIAAFLKSYRRIIAKAEEKQIGDAPFFPGPPGDVLVRRALDKTVTTNFVNQPLTDVVASLSKQLKLPIVIHRKSLEDFGIDPSTPVTADFNDLPLQLALRRMLHELELTFAISNEVLMITTPEDAENRLRVGLYPLRDLVANAGARPAGYDFDSVIEVLTSTVAPDSWDEVGGPGSISVLLREPTLVISQTQHVHEKITNLLKELRLAKKEEQEHLAEIDAAASERLRTRAYKIERQDIQVDEVLQLVTLALHQFGFPDKEFILPLGRSIVLHHNAAAHRRVEKLLREVGATRPLGQQVLPRSGSGGFGSGSGGGFF